MQIGFSEPFCTHSNKSQCTQKEAKKGLDFFSIPPYFGTTFFQIYVCPQCIFMQLKAEEEALIKLVWEQCLIKLEQQYNKGLYIRVQKALSYRAES